MRGEGARDGEQQTLENRHHRIRHALHQREVLLGARHRLGHFADGTHPQHRGGVAEAVLRGVLTERREDRRMALILQQLQRGAGMRDGPLLGGRRQRLDDDTDAVAVEELRGFAPGRDVTADGGTGFQVDGADLFLEQFLHDHPAQHGVQVDPAVPAALPVDVELVEIFGDDSVAFGALENVAQLDEGEIVATISPGPTDVGRLEQPGKVEKLNRRKFFSQKFLNKKKWKVEKNLRWKKIANLPH